MGWGGLGSGPVGPGRGPAFAFDFLLFGFYDFWTLRQMDPRQMDPRQMALTSPPRSDGRQMET